MFSTGDVVEWIGEDCLVGPFKNIAIRKGERRVVKAITTCGRLWLSGSTDGLFGTVSPFDVRKLNYDKKS